MKLEDLNYKISTDLIATEPKFPRDDSNLLIFNKEMKIIKFKDIIKVLKPRDLLVVNNTKVLNSSLEGMIEKRKISLNLNKVINKYRNKWSVFIKSNKKVKEKEKIEFKFGITCKVCEIVKNTGFIYYNVIFNTTYDELLEILLKNGDIPIPPYIKKKRSIKESDNINYQTIFAKKLGAVASPTASLHFTEKLINKLTRSEINFAFLTLHVNGGTFLPIRENDPRRHIMHYEKGIIPKSEAEKINKTKINGGRIIAVGTTVLRLLESSKDKNGFIKAFDGETNIFIKPGWKVNTVDGLITNFHTPKSTLLMLVYALIGKVNTLKLYKYAIEKKMRFFSYGDACLLWVSNAKR